MRCSIKAMVVAVAALAALAGCSSDDGGGPVGTPVPTNTRTSTRTTAPTNTSGPTATPTPQPVAGEYSAALGLGEGATAEIEFDVDAEGEAEGTVVLEDPTEGNAAGAGGAAAIISVGVLGTVDTETGAFDLGGTFPGAGGLVTIQLTGVLPGAGRTGTVTLSVNGETYTGPLGIVVPTATATSEVPVATPTPTSGGGEPTPTAGLINGLSTDLIGTWVGTAENESTGVEKAVRLRVAASGSNIVVTDLNGNVFRGSSSVTVVVRTPMAMSYNAFGPPVIALTLSSLNGSQLVGIYGVTTTTFPPVVESLGLVLSKES